MSFFQVVIISLLKETILAGTATTQTLIIVMRIHMVSTILTVPYIQHVRHGNDDTIIINLRPRKDACFGCHIKSWRKSTWCLIDWICHSGCN
jgi:hypothetical protein